MAKKARGVYMRRLSKLAVLCVLFGSLLCVSAQALENDMLKVGIKYGGDAMFSANLQNYNDAVAGLGYTMGYFDSQRVFVPVGMATQEYKISITADGNFYASGNAYYPGTGGVGGYHLQLTETFGDYDAAAEAAARYEGAFVAYLTNVYAVRVGQYASEGEAQTAFALWGGADAVRAVGPSSTGVVVTVTGTNRVLFYFDCGGLRSLAIMPRSVAGEKPVTWFRGYRYYGGFEYQRVTGGTISVINVVNIEDYTKGCVPWEIGNDKPLEAIKAQAVCARTYAAMQKRHRAQGFDVCTTDDCQVYQGVAASNEMTDRAVDETAGVYMYYNGELVEAFYCSSNGGASEDAENVWGNEVAYCKGKTDPFEAMVASRIPQYNWTVTYTQAELTNRLQSRGIDVGTVRRVYVSELTPTGNVYALTIEGSSGSRTIYRESCRTVLGLRSMRFTVGGGDGDSYYVNDTESAAAGIRGAYIISGGGAVSLFSAGAADVYVITSSGVSALRREAAPASSNVFTFAGSGWGHNVGMSQWGATAMAELGYTYRAILEFYYTGVLIG